MAENKDVIVDVEQVYSKSEEFFNKNKNVIVGAVAIVVIAIAGFFSYNNLYLAPLNKEASDLMWKAEYYFETNDWDKALDGDGNNFGFLYIIDNYGGTKAGKLANFYAGTCFMQKGEFETAIDYLKSADLNDELIGAVAKGSVGDAYVELGQLSDAVSWFNKAISHSRNEFSAPIYLMKKAQVQAELGEYDAALASYKEIKEDFPASSEAKNIDKNIAFIEANLN